MHKVITTPSKAGTSAVRWRSLVAAVLLALVGIALCAHPRAGAVAYGPRIARPVFLELNIPAFRLDLWEEGTLVRSYTVAVGMRRHKTPTGEFEVARIVWNPWWYPPDAEWAAKDTVTPPGPRNPMGKVKLLFNGPYYLHGTPLESSLGQAASHGCVRMRNADAVELATLLQRAGGLDVSAAAMDSMTSSWKRTRMLQLVRLIPVMIVYHTAEVRDSTLMLYPDTYRMEAVSSYARAMAALSDAGVDTTQVDTILVRQLTQRARHARVTVPLQQLLAPDAEGGFTP